MRTDKRCQNGKIGAGKVTKSKHKQFIRNLPVPKPIDDEIEDGVGPRNYEPTIRTGDIPYHTPKFTFQTPIAPTSGDISVMPTLLDKENEQLGRAAAAARVARTMTKSTCIHRIESSESQEEGAEEGSFRDLDNVIKSILSLGTTQELNRKVEEAESVANALHSEILKAKLVESHLMCEKEITERVFTTAVTLITAHNMNDSQRSLEALEKEIEEQLTIIKKCIKQSELEIANLMEKQKEQERRIILLKWSIAMRQVIDEWNEGKYRDDIECLLDGSKKPLPV